MTAHIFCLLNSETAALRPKGHLLDLASGEREHTRCVRKVPQSNYHIFDFLDVFYSSMTHPTLFHMAKNTSY